MNQNTMRQRAMEWCGRDPWLVFAKAKCGECNVDVGTMAEDGSLRVVFADGTGITVGPDLPNDWMPILSESERNAEEVEILLEVWGEGANVMPWRNFAHTVDGCPDWITDLPEDTDRDTAICVLYDSMFGTPDTPAGYVRAYAWQCGERSCPWCGDGTGNEATRPHCSLCEGDGLIYWGEGEHVFVFVKAPQTAMRDAIVNDLREVRACAQQNLADCDGELDVRLVVHEWPTDDDTGRWEVRHGDASRDTCHHGDIAAGFVHDDDTDDDLGDTADHLLSEAWEAFEERMATEHEKGGTDE